MEVVSSTMSYAPGFRVASVSSSYSGFSTVASRPSYVTEFGSTSSLILFSGIVTPPGFVLEDGSLETGWKGKIGDVPVSVFWDEESQMGKFIIEGEVINANDIWVWCSPMYQSLRKEVNGLRKEVNEMKEKLEELYYAPGMPGAIKAIGKYCKDKE